MASKKIVNLKDFIYPLNMNGLQGRMLKTPSKAKTREILLVYGHHATLERWFGLVHELLRYGGVTMADLPGFGGMTSLNNIGEKLSLDIYADYLATFIKLCYKQRRLTIVAEGFGFLVATRMLQRYREVAKKVDLVVSLGGVAHHEDLKFSRWQKSRYRVVAHLFGSRPLAWALKKSCFNNYTLNRAYRRSKAGSWRHLLEATSFPSKSNEQIGLWQSCDLATHLSTIGVTLSVDNCETQVRAPAIIINLPNDAYIDKHLAEQHLRVVYDDCQFLEAKTGRRKVFGTDAKTAAVLLPHRLRAELKRPKP